jgi:hypothetical protein
MNPAALSVAATNPILATVGLFTAAGMYAAKSVYEAVTDSTLWPDEAPVAPSLELVQQQAMIQQAIQAKQARTVRNIAIGVSGAVIVVVLASVAVSRKRRKRR